MLINSVSQIDTSYLIGLAVMAVLFLLSIAAGVLAGWLAESHRVLAGVGATLACWLVLAVLFTLGAWPPLPGQYNSYTLAQGTVKAVGSRFIASGTQGGGSTQKFGVQFSTGQTFGCNDTRCSSLKPGQKVSLWCERVFQFNAAEGWDCNFAQYGLMEPTAALDPASLPPARY